MTAPPARLLRFEIYGLEKIGGPFKAELINCSHGILEYRLEVPRERRREVRVQLWSGVTAARLDGQLIHLQGATAYRDTDLGFWLTSPYTWA